jgi:hypothetical protein
MNPRIAQTFCCMQCLIPRTLKLFQEIIKHIVRHLDNRFTKFNVSEQADTADRWR